MKRADILSMFGVGFQQNGIVPITGKDTIILFINREVDNFEGKLFTPKCVGYCGTGKGNQRIDWAYTSPILPEAKNAILAMAPDTTALLLFEVDGNGDCSFLGNFRAAPVIDFRIVNGREVVLFTLIRPEN